jgi:hypothetical protein
MVKNIMDKDDHTPAYGLYTSICQLIQYAKACPESDHAVFKSTQANEKPVDVTGVCTV